MSGRGGWGGERVLDLLSIPALARRGAEEVSPPKEREKT